VIDKKLIALVPRSKAYIFKNIAAQWVSLIANIAIMATIARLLSLLYHGDIKGGILLKAAIIIGIAMLMRYVCTIIASRMSYLSSKEVKQRLRTQIFSKLLRLGSAYTQHVKTSEVVQVAVEGVEQLETYFGQYLPQFFYAMLAPITLFAVLSFVNLPAAAVLLICVPLIPVTIVAVQRWAKKLLSKYWGAYTDLGDTFLENLQGLTTTKIYKTDGFKHEEMNRQSERFRRITMKVLLMQLNSISIMDLIAYGGAALGVILAAWQFKAGRVDIVGSLLILLLAADFFLPMRLLGSFFHIAMNGIAASDKIFRLLNLPEPETHSTPVPDNKTIYFQNLSFAYEKDRPVLKDIGLIIPQGSFTAIVGESGSGKSTMAHLIMGKAKGYSGKLTVGGIPLSTLSEKSIMQNFSYIGHRSYIFKGTVRDNLLMAAPNADDKTLWSALNRVALTEFLKSEQGLDTPLLEQGANFSGGQRQRLALARALLHNSSVYIFDEATSNIDVESENIILDTIHSLSKTKTVILIAHRLANVVSADNIYVLKEGALVEQGAHECLLSQKGYYFKLWETQQALTAFNKGGKA